MSDYFTGQEGSARESQKDYLHFLYIARGSLTETQYFIHLASRLSYLNSEEAEGLISQTKQAFACLHGLIKAVEKESGKLSSRSPVARSPVVSSSPKSRSPVVPSSGGPVVRSLVVPRRDA
jgi:hypothetical protein